MPSASSRHCNADKSGSLSLRCFAERVGNIGAALPHRPTLCDRRVHPRLVLHLGIQLRAQQYDIGTDVEPRSEEHTSELQSLMRTSYAVFCLKKKKQKNIHHSDSLQNK